MKRSSSYVVRIIIWSLVGLLSTGILVSAIVLGSFTEVINKAFNWSESSMEVINERNFNPQGVENINVEWIDGTINIYPWDENNIKIVEKKRGRIKEEEILDVIIKDQTLFIKQKKQKRIFTIFSFRINKISRDIILPKNIYQEIKINGTSGKLTMEKLEANQIDLKLTSGKIETNNISGKNLTTKLTSGSINIVGGFETLDADVTSGLISLDLDKAPSKMMVKLTSGKATISIPENQGFTLYESKVAGAIKNEFTIDDFGVYKNGEYKYSIKITSGLVELFKKPE